MGRLEKEWGRTVRADDSQDALTEEIVGEAQKDVDAFLSLLVREGQKVYKAFTAASDRVEKDYYKGHYTLDHEALRKRLRAHIEQRSPWGKDEMTPLLVRLIESGDFVL